MASSALAQACQLLAEKYGDTGDELGEAYLLYGRALLGLAREEAGVLGGGVPGTEEIDEGDEDEDEEELEEEKLSNADDAAKNENEVEAEGESVPETETEPEPEHKHKHKHEHKTEPKPELEPKGENQELAQGNVNNNLDRRGNVEPCKPGAISSQGQPKDQGDVAQSSNPLENSSSLENQTPEEAVGHPTESKQTSIASSSKSFLGSRLHSDVGHSSGSATQNGEPKRHNEDEEGEDIAKDEADDEDDVNNLQVAWEVLELAKLVLSKRGKAGWKQLADAYRLLGEVAMEGGNHQGALSDLRDCLELLEKIEPRDARAIAEIHYQLALAHSLGNDFDASVEEFTNATALLKTRIEELERTKEPPKTDDTFYTVEGEISELKELLPEIQEKINDMKDFKEEACRLVIEGIKSKVAGGNCTNGAGTSNDETSATCSAASSGTTKVQKPASDISHLIRKKRKADESDSEAASPCKKPTPEPTPEKTP